MKTKALKNESGQAIILFAVLAPLLLAFMGLAVEGGRLFTEYRRMQAAADMAALVGAQDLPCSGATCSNVEDESYWCALTNFYGSGNVPGNSGVSCNSTATPQAAVSGGVSAIVSIPPTSCSPYDSFDYGNKSTNGSCNQYPATNPNDDYIEVQLTQSIQVPIFNYTFNMYSHAVARHGEDTPKDYAMTMLAPSATDMSLGGSGLVVVGSVVSDSTDPNSSINTVGGSSQAICDGGWFTSSSEGVQANIQTGTNGTPQYAPPACNYVNNTPDSPTVWHSNWQYVPDPYCSTLSPPISLSLATGVTDADWGTCRDGGSDAGTRPTWSNCQPCANVAYGYSWSSNRNAGTWYTASSSGANKLPNSLGSGGGTSWELFPGVYENGLHIATGSTVYLNPGVYTMEGALQIDAQVNVCIYGAPACPADNVLRSSINPSGPSDYSCSTVNFGASNVTGATSYTVTSSTWNYYCSPWGFWDSYILNASNSPSPPALTAPTFECPTKSQGTYCASGTAQPLNGVTFYTVGANNVTINGGSNLQLAAPNSCPGTGTQTTSPNGVPWFDPSGSGTASGLTPGTGTGYSEPTGSRAANDLFTSGYNVYPSPDLTIAGECKQNGWGNVWPGEFGMPAVGTSSTISGVTWGTDQELSQHLHFLIYARDGNSKISITGGSGENFYGIIYNPGATANTKQQESEGCYSNSSNCQIAIAGSSGGGGSNNAPLQGPPMMVGQVVGDTFKYTGSAQAELFYRPCDPKTTSCASGAGSGLVE